MKVSIIILIILSSMVLSGCGQYGALSLPKTNVESHKKVPARADNADAAVISSTVQKARV